MSESVNRSQDAVSLDSSPTMAMSTLYSAAVGPIGNDYYLPLFSKFEAAGRATLSWNWAACLYTVNWMIFRRLWGAALVFAGAMLGTALMLAVLGLLVFEWPRELLYQLLLADLGLGMLASGLWGNALFYNHCRQAMMTAVADNKTLVQACAQLSQHSSTRQRFIRLLLVNALLLSLAAAATAYLMLWGHGNPATEASATAPTPALAASATEPAAPASATSATSAGADTPAAPSSEPASAPAAPPAAMAASLPVALPVSAPAAAHLVMPAASLAAAPVAVASKAPTASSSPAPSSAFAASQTAPKPAKAAASHAKVAAPAASHATSHAPNAAHAKASAAGKPHAASKPAAKTAAKPTAKPAPAKATAAKASQPAKVATPAGKALYINAGLFANPDNARNALAKLQAAGMPATAQEIDTSQGPRTRIRVGPIATAMQAQATIEQIKALNLDAALVKP